MYLRKIKEMLEYCELCNTDDKETIPSQVHDTTYSTKTREQYHGDGLCHHDIAQEKDYKKLLLETKETIYQQREYLNRK